VISLGLILELICFLRGAAHLSPFPKCKRGYSPRLTADRRTSRLTNLVVGFGDGICVRRDRIMQLFPLSHSAHIQIVGCMLQNQTAVRIPDTVNFCSRCRAKTASLQPPCPFARLLGLGRLGTGPSILENSGTPLLPISSSHLGKRALTDTHASPPTL